MRNESGAPGVGRRTQRHLGGSIMLRPLILWLLGVPFGIILLLLLFGIV
jgi:hypothetical protein